MESFIKLKLGLLIFFSFTVKVMALEQSYYKEKSLDVPYREQSIIISKDGYFPNRIIAFKGEKIKFFVTTVGNEGSCFNIPDKNLYSTATALKIVEAETFFDKVGIFQFNCPNSQYSGRVVVIEKASDKVESARRGLASDVVKVWRPKETPDEWIQIKREEFKELKGMSDVMDLDKE